MLMGYQAQEKAKPDASAIYVPGHLTAKAIEEAIEAEISLVVAVAEHVPIHDLLRVCYLNEISFQPLANRVGPLHATNPIQNQTGRRKLSRHHFSYWQMPDRFPAIALLYPR